MTDDFGGASGENLPGYVLANTRLDWKDIGGSGLTLGVYVRNLFGERYFTSPSVLLKSVPVNSVYVGEPRTRGVTGRFNFRSEEHTSELQSLMRLSYAVFCFKKETRSH